MRKEDILNTCMYVKTDEINLFYSN